MHSHPVPIEWRRHAARTIALLGICVCVVGGFALSAPASGADVSIELSGTAYVDRAVGLGAMPAKIDSGLVEIGDSTIERFTLTHTGAPGSDAVEIGKAELIGTHADEYTTGFDGFRTLSAGQSFTIDVQFTPVSPGKKAATLVLDVKGSSAPFALFLEGRSRFPLTSTLAAKDESLDFGSTVIGKSVSKTLVLENDGEPGAPSIAVTDLVIDGNQSASFASNFKPTMIEPGQKLNIQLTMSDTAIGTKTAQIQVLHDGANAEQELVVELTGELLAPQAVKPTFGKSNLKGASVKRGTALQFGPDGRLYVTEMNGLIHVYDVSRNGKNNYTVTKHETIDVVLDVPNHDDDGKTNGGVKGRLITGIHVTGTAAKPVIYLASSDPRQDAGPSSNPSGDDSNLDTNSGILHRIEPSGTGWKRFDLVRGLPRSEENHVPNGLYVQGNTLYLLTGGHTNQGVRSTNFAMLPEYALSAALLEIDLGQVGNGTYDLPTLDDEDRSGANDANDPFGGNDGKNQAKLVKNGPVQIYASGLRNAYDLVMSQAGKLYTFDNGPNTNWGPTPNADCIEPDIENPTSPIMGGSKHDDNLHLLTKGYYAGHPNLTRGDKGNTFNKSNPQTPIEIGANPKECDYKVPGKSDGALVTHGKSTNGIDEYTASNFGLSMQGDLIAAAFGGTILRVELNGSGTAVTAKSTLFENVGKTPLDVTSQGDNDVFPGTIWVVDNQGTDIIVFEPGDY